MTLPEMTVELRTSTTAHNLKAPVPVNSPDFEAQLSDMIEFVDGAKTRANKVPAERWEARVIELLGKYAPFTMTNPKEALAEFGFYSWAECVEFVMDDNCDDFASIVLRWTQKNAIPHAESLGFIDGDGTGFKTEYLHELNNKGTGELGTLEKAFDAKYYYKRHRPLVELSDRMGSDAAHCMINYVHPGHWAYPAGHGVKFFSTVKVVRDRWVMSAAQDNVLLTAAYVLAMARSGGGVHYPRDNTASGYLSGLPEFAEYAAS